MENGDTPAAGLHKPDRTRRAPKPPPPDRVTRPLTMVEAAIPIGALILLILASVLLFGDKGAYGPNQIAMVVAGMVVVIVALRAGHSLESMNKAAIASVSSGLGAIFILFAVGALIGAWAVSGTLVAMIYYGMQYLDPNAFYFSAALICAAVATCLGSSWTTAGTLGVGFMGIATNMGLDPAIAAGAVISGAYVGELVSPLSDTANLAAASANISIYQQLRAAILPTLVALALALVGFWLLGSPATHDTAAELALIERHFHMTPWLFLPLAVVAAMALLRLSPFTTIMSGAAAGMVVALVTAPERLIAFADPEGALPGFVAAIKGVWLILASGYVSNLGYEPLDTLQSRGGMDSMLLTIWLVMAALAFGGVVEKAGVLDRLVAPVLARAKSGLRVVSSLVGSAIAANLITADQYIALVLPGRMFAAAMAKLGYGATVLTRSVALAATPTSALVPWNSCGAYMAAALGVSTLSYLPYAFFNLLAPALAIAMAAANLAMPRTDVPADSV